MKKYYCPYCGELTRKWSHKIKDSLRNIVARQQRHCDACGQYVTAKGAFNNRMLFLVSGICLIFVVTYLVPEGKPGYEYLCVLAGVLLVAQLVLEVLFGKFVKRDEDARDDKYYPCVVEMTDAVKHPALYFYGTAVVLLRFEKESVPVAVRIEPLEINHKTCKCKVAFVLKNPSEDFAGKAFALIDNEETVGNGHFE